MSNLNKALELAGVQLFSVFPVQPGTKVPYPGTNGIKDATNDQFLIEEMWSKHPEAIPAVATGASRIMVIDIDTKKGKDGFAALAAKGLSLPTTFNYETPSGGKHYVYFLKNSKSYKQQTNYDGLEGVDRQSGESYVVWHGEVPWDAEMVAPPVWAITRGVDAAAAAEAYAGSLSEWTTRLRPKAANDYAVNAFLHDLANVRHIGNGELRNFLWRLACDVQAGHPSTLDAFGALRLKYDSTSNEPESKRDSEFERLLRGAIGGAQARDAAGELVHFLEGAYTPPEAVAAVEPPSGDLQVLTWSDLREIPAPVWMVDSLLRESSLAILAGAGGLGKTYLALYLACAVATGSEALGLKTGEPAKVLYVGAEGIESFNTRLEAIQSYYGLPRDLMEQNLRFIEEGVNLADEDANNRLATVVKENGFRLIVLDTFSQLVPMKSENDAAEVAGVMREVKRLRTLSPKSCILFLHHAAKDSGRYRGSSAVRDNVDTLISAWGKSKGFSISTDSEQSGKQRSGAPFTLNGLEIVTHGDDSVVALTGAKTVTADESNWKLIRDLLSDGTARTRAEIASETALSEEVTKKIVQKAKDALMVAHKVGRTEYLTLTPLPTQSEEPELRSSF